MRRLFCGLIPLSVVATAWLGFWWSGYGVLIARVTKTVETQSTVECHYLHATGRREVIEFTTDPRSIACASYARVRSASPTTGRPETRWAAPLPTDQRVEIECRFFERHSGRDGGLGMRFSPASPLRLVIHLADGKVTFVSADDQAALGAPVLTEATPRSIMLRFEDGTLPAFTGAYRGRLTIFISPRDGQAAMFLLARSNMHLLWARVGGCRASASVAPTV